MIKQIHNLIHYFLVILLTLFKSVLYVFLGAIFLGIGIILIFSDQPFYIMVIGIPAILVGISIIIINIGTLIEVTVNKLINRAHCTLCELNDL